MFTSISAVVRAWAIAGCLVVSTPVLAQLGGPVNSPPAGYQGLQFVDAKGCLFLRAGYGAQTLWVPMVDENHQPICGMPPTGGAPRLASVPAPEPAPAVQTSATPGPQATARQGYETAPLGSAQASCPGDAPVLERVRLSDGGTALVCTRGDGTLNGWQPPLFVGGAAVGAALGYASATVETLKGATLLGPIGGPAAATPAPAAVAGPAPAADVIPKPPKGWKLAWKDGRLNPLRGVGTARGQAMQDRIWTRTVPAVLVAQAAPATRPVTRVATMSAPVPQAKPVAQTPAAGLYVQIGGFAVAANARAAVARIEALDLPATTTSRLRGGQALDLVMAGPFAGRAVAAAALAALRGAGFADAYIRER